ncbi:MarR family winged helix-turn-helix transcriptional regulator [Kitasatospora sp. NPDC127111]|uniref:MarR family winged helix-turn-helix transcriptional regulator n=1 Tax=Kitasatospora sp. NPDC127111 TaxID=3345363 RepID=UPI0036388587
MDERDPTPATGAGCADLTADFGFSLMSVAHAYRAAVSPALAGIPQGARGYQTLAAVVHGERPNQLALATYLRIDRTVMTYLLDDLAAAGLVERRPDPSDRRRRLILATPKGAATLAALERQVAEAEASLLSVIDETDRAVLRELLARISQGVQNTGQETCDTPPPCA